MFPWTVPDEIVHFIWEQFERFKAPAPQDKVIDEVASFVLEYVAKNKYYPHTSEEALARYHNRPGLTEPEKFQLLGPIEFRVKAQLFINVSIEQLHLTVWSALFYCWSSEGEYYVDWWRRHEVGEKARSEIQNGVNEKRRMVV